MIIAHKRFPHNKNKVTESQLLDQNPPIICLQQIAALYSISMAKIKHPKAKKALDYTRQHFSAGKYDKAFRRQWPRKKRLISRGERRAVALNLRISDQDLQSAEEAELRTYNVKREKPVKWHIETLRERVRRKREALVSRFRARIKRQRV